MDDIEAAIAEAVRAIVAGTPVDWAAVESGRSEDHFHDVLRDLKIVSQIANLHRTLHETSNPSSPSVVGTPSQTVHTVPTWGTLTLLEPVGAGSFGEVYRAWDPRLDREVALKLLRQSNASADRLRSRSVHEARLLARLRHPNIVTVYGADVIDGRVGIWMEFVRGRTLEAIVRERGPMSAEEAVPIVLAVCRALGAVHHAGFVHRDVKAQNVMEDDDGRIVLMDFGTGEELAQAGAGGLAGTPAYIAPEILEGEGATPKSDSYSLGILLFYLTTASYPVHGRTMHELRRAHRAATRRRLEDVRPDLPRDVIDVVDRALAPRPSDRFQSTEAFEKALGATIEPPRAESIPPTHPRRRWLLGFASVAFALAALLGWRWIADEIAGGNGRSDSRAAAGIAAGSTLRKADVPDFIPSGPPSRTGRWLTGINWKADGNLELLDLFSGARRILTTKPKGDGYTERSAISPDERSIAYSWYATPRQEFSELRTIGIDGHAEKTIYRNDEGTTSPVGWSLDGQRVLIMFERSGGPRLAWVDTRTGTSIELARLPSFPRNISLSPDAGLVAYDLPTTAGDVDRDLYICDAVTGRAAPLLVEPANDLAPVWTPDGRGVVFSSNRGGNLGLWYVPITRMGQLAGEPRLLRGDMGKFSPLGFGRDAAFFYQAITGTVDVYVAKLDLRTGTISPPRTVATRFIGTNLFSDWSPDGQSLIFTSRRGEVGFERKSQVLVIRDLPNNDERVIAPDLTGISVPRWSPDGRSILVRGDGPQGPGLYRMSALSGAASAVLIQRGPANLPEWRRDGAAVWFIAPGQGRGQIHELTLATRAERTIVDGARAFALSHDGRRLAFARGEPAGGISIQAGAADNGPSTEILKNPPGSVVELVGWTRDDLELLIARRTTQQAPAEILAVPVAGGTPRRLATVDLSGPRSMRLSRDGKSLAFEAGYPAQSMWVLEQFLNR
jgi:serine/threonine-protein kinase